MLSDIIKSTTLKQQWIESTLIHLLNLQAEKGYEKLVLWILFFKNGYVSTHY